MVTSRDAALALVELELSLDLLLLLNVAVESEEFEVSFYVVIYALAFYTEGWLPILQAVNVSVLAPAMTTE